MSRGGCTGLRVRHEGRHAREPEHPDGREGPHGRGRDGEHVRRAVSPSPSFAPRTSASCAFIPADHETSISKGSTTLASPAHLDTLPLRTPSSRTVSPTSTTTLPWETGESTYPPSTHPQLTLTLTSQRREDGQGPLDHARGPGRVRARVVPPLRRRLVVWCIRQGDRARHDR